MGNSSSKIHATNDYELVIKTSKELEHLLSTEFGAKGQGLHEKITFVSQNYPQYFSNSSSELIRHLRFLATIRNKLVHEHGFDKIPDRETFIKKFEYSTLQLNRIIEARKRDRSGSSSTATQCVIS
jgi:hypothetical protein